MVRLALLLGIMVVVTSCGSYLDSTSVPATALPLATESIVPMPMTTEDPIPIPVVTEEIRQNDIDDFQTRLIDLERRVEAIAADDFSTALSELRTTIDDFDLTTDDYDMIWGDINRQLSELSALIYLAERRARSE